MLRALKRLLVPGGRIAHTTIYVVPGLSPTLRRRANRCGPRAVASRTTQRRLLESAGFVDVDELDLTAAWLLTARAWLDELEANADELEALQAPGTFAQRLADNHAQLAAVEDGLLRRGLFSARRR